MTVHHLDNGLTVSIQEDSSIGLVALDMWVGVGSGDEPPELAGISHYLEHMLFKGTERLATGEYDRRIEEIGGYLNAATSVDYTHYYTVFPADHFNRVLSDFADVLTNSILAPEEIERERQVILEEISRKQDSPFGYLFDESVPVMFESGPYSHPVIGFPETVAAFTRDQILDHYRRFYVPGNMFLAIVGDVDTHSTLEAVREAFGSLNRPLLPHRTAPPETSYHPPMDRLLPREWAEAYFIIGFPAPEAATSRQLAIRDLAETLLVGGKSSRLVRSLQERKRLVSSISAWFPEQRYPAPLLIFGTCIPQNIPEVHEEIHREVELLLRDGIPAAEMARVRRMVLNAQLFALETGRQRAGVFGHAMLRYGRIEIIDEYRRDLERVSPSEVLDFIATNLRRENSSFFVTRRTD